MSFRTVLTPNHYTFDSNNHSLHHAEHLEHHGQRRSPRPTYLLVKAIAAGLPDQDDPSHTPALAPMQTMLSAMPRDMQQDAARHLRHTLDHGLPPSAQAMLDEQAESTARLLSSMQAKLQDQEKEQHARIAIHHYHCDHLGTPMALTDQTGQVAWAAKLDPWGNVLQEYNPQGIHQVIRLPGQHHDRETGCITTGIGITIRWWGVCESGSDWMEWRH